MQYIVGVRHKCLDCPDWDYCVKCVQNAHVSHPRHRFAAIYDPLADLHASAVMQPTHLGICCDGPLCQTNVGTYIRGVRYKCAVCHDLDFCANCEASPANDHNKTHPLIKFKTPVRHVTVSTSGEHQDGTRMPTLGDRLYTCSKATGTASLVSANTINTVQTVVDVKPTESASPPPRPAKQVAEPEPKVEPVAAQTEVKPQAEDLHAVFLRDSVPDGTVLPPNHVFEQTWVLRNEGKTIWPAGCSVKFVGGDYMGHVDSAHPAGISELVSASESTVCYAKLSPGQECSFTALLRTPSRIGKMISYWRLTAPDGTRFGHRLWCEVNVRAATCSAAQVTAPEPEPKPAGAPVSSSTPLGKTEAEQTSQESSTMIFPKVETESPSASVHEEYSQTTSDATGKTNSETYKDEDDEWDLSDDDFLTEEEYDVLDASDEEFAEELRSNILKK